MLRQQSFSYYSSLGYSRKKRYRQTKKCGNGTRQLSSLEYIPDNYIELHDLP